MHAPDTGTSNRARIDDAFRGELTEAGFSYRQTFGTGLTDSIIPVQ